MTPKQMQSLADSLSHLHATRKTGNIRTCERYAFTNAADCQEIESVIDRLEGLFRELVGLEWHEWLKIRTLQ